MTKALEIGTVERLLAEWREAQAVVDTLLEFRDNGGEHRLRMRTDGPESAVPGSLIERILADHGGYKAAISFSIDRAQKEAEQARAAFLAECSGQHMADLAAASTRGTAL